MSRQKKVFHSQAIKLFEERMTILLKQVNRLKDLAKNGQMVAVFRSGYTVREHKVRSHWMYIGRSK